MATETSTLLRRLRRQGFEVKRTRRHWAVYRDGRRVCTLPVTPSDYRGQKNALAQLTRAGYEKKRR